jgi:hypothetical protein
MKKSLLVFLGALVCLFSGFVNAEQATPCSKSKQVLPFQAYGLQTPKGWSCFAPIKNPEVLPKLFYWQKGSKKIYFFLSDIDSSVSEEDKKDMPGIVSLKEPQRAIRIDAECLVGNSEQYKNIPHFNKLTKVCAQKPRGLLFSKDRKQALFFTDEGMVERHGKNVRMTDAKIYKKDEPQTILNAACYGCDASEFFEFVVTPIIQK